MSLALCRRHRRSCLTLHLGTHLRHDLLKWTERYPYWVQGQMTDQHSLCSPCPFLLLCSVCHSLAAITPFSFPSHSIIDWRLHYITAFLSFISSPLSTVLTIIFSYLSVTVGYTSIPKSNALQYHSQSVTHSCSPGAGALNWHCPSSDINSNSQREKDKLENFRREQEIIKSGVDLVCLPSPPCVFYWLFPH